MSLSSLTVDAVIDLTADNELSATRFRRTEPPPCVAAEVVQVERSFARPWWHRLAHFVPAAAIEYDDQEKRGINPRTGETVYVDYLNQFNADASRQVTVKEITSRHEGRSRDGRPSVKGRYSEGALRGEWTTNARGKEVFRTNDGKEYVGMKAYKMHARILTQQTQNLKVEGRT